MYLCWHYLCIMLCFHGWQSRQLTGCETWELVSSELGKFCVIYSSLWELDRGQTLWQDVLWFGWSWHAVISLIRLRGNYQGEPWHQQRESCKLLMTFWSWSNTLIELEMRREIIWNWCPNKIKTLSRCAMSRDLAHSALEKTYPCIKILDSCCSMVKNGR